LRLQWRKKFRMDALAAGVLLAVLRVQAPARFERLAGWRWLWAIVTAAGLCFLATVTKSSPLGSTLGYTVAYLTGAAFLLFVHGAAWVPRAGWVTRPVAALGRYSYGIYIWHVFAAELVLGLLPGMDYGASGPAAQGAKFASAIAVGVLATLVLERPVLRLRDRLVPAASRAAEPRPQHSEPAPVRVLALSGGSPRACEG
jgi:peptidoglycan/LPS O-acetylase OafA/YrhL